MSRSQILDSPKQCPNYLCFKFIYLCILRRLQNFAKYPQVICPIYCQSDNWWRFRKILWPFQNVWTLHRVIGSLDVRSLCVKVYRLSHLLLPQEFHLFYSIQVFYNSYEIMCVFLTNINSRKLHLLKWRGYSFKRFHFTSYFSLLFLYFAPIDCNL